MQKTPFSDDFLRVKRTSGSPTFVRIASSTGPGTAAVEPAAVLAIERRRKSKRNIHKKACVFGFAFALPAVTQLSVPPCVSARGGYFLFLG